MTLDDIKKTAKYQDIDGSFITEEGYYVDTSRFGWRGERNHDYEVGRWSPGNSSAAQMQFVTNKQDYKALQQAAIDEENAIAKYNRELADSERLRDEQREYDDPASVLARERAAGINSDIVGGSAGSVGSGGSSPISAPTMAETDVNAQMASPYATADRVFSGMQAAASLISSITGGMDIGLDFAERVATWDDRMTISRNAATKSDQNVNQGSIELVNKTLDQTGSLVSRLDGTKEYTDDELSTYYTDWTGQKDEDGSAVRRMRHFMSSPQMQQEYADRALAAKRSKATYQALPFNFLSTQAEIYWKTQRYQSNFDMIFAGYRDAYAKLFYTGDNAALQASTDSQSLSNQSDLVSLEGSQIDQQRKEFDDYLDRYAFGLTFIKDEVARLDMEIQAVESILDSDDPKINRPELRNRLLSLQLEKYETNAIGASNFHEICNFMLKHGSTQYHYDSNFNIERDATGKVTSTGLQSAKFQENEYLWNSTMWSKTVQNNYGKDDFLQTILQLTPWVGFGVGKGVSGVKSFINRPKPIGFHP